MTTGRGYISMTIDSRGRALSSTTISRPPERHIRMAPAISPAGMASSQSSSLDSTHSSQYSSRKRESDLSDQSTPKKPKSSSHRKPREKAMHKYEVDQEVFLAEHLATPRINELLNGTNDRNRFPIPKAKVHEEIAFEFNEKFGTSLDGGQIKNKVASMQKQWRAGRKLITDSNALDRPDPTLRSRVLKECHFYYIVEPVWSVALSNTPRKPLENTNHHPEEAPSDIEYESNEDVGGQDENGQDENGQDENGQDNNFEEQNYEFDESRREQWIQEPAPPPQEHQLQQDKNLLAELRSLVESLKPSLLNSIYADRSASDENAMAHARKMRELEGEVMCTRELIKLEQLRLEIEKVKLEQLKIRAIQDST
ncbi:hypothetical protein BGZ79_008403 [Entomortierella chlamydospora]|nr:hypothetical protein BGZ79_008403 [Entomortierella chlamydospora]